MFEQFLINNGWKLIGRCRCGGKSQRKYFNISFPDFKIVHFTGSGTFALLKNNRRILPIDEKTDNIQQILIDYEIN